MSDPSKNPLPVYTKGEEVFNMTSHIVGGAAGVVALVLGIIRAALHHSAAGVAGAIVFGFSLILLYTISSVYHGLRPGPAKRVLRVLDHCTIYVLIAGSYTPVLLSAMRPLDPAASWKLFAAVWALAILAIVLNAVDLKRFRVFAMICYLAMGWCIVLELPLMIRAVGHTGFLLLLAGGLCYTLGAVLYGVGKKRRWFHSIFHLFVLAGSILHILAILICAL